MRLFVLLASFCSIPFLGNGQSGQNPFDIQSRLDSSYQEIQDVQDDRDLRNVFDVVRTDKTIRNKEASIDALESKDSTNIKAESYQPEVIKNKPFETNEIETNGNNPFEVSHIPLRKSKLKQEADAFSPVDSRGKDKPITSNTFIFWLVLVSALIIAIVINTKTTVITKLIKAISNGNILKHTQREERNGFSIHYLLLYLSYFINGGIFLYLIISKYLELNGIENFFYCVVVIFGIYTLKHLAIRMLGNLFPIKKHSSLYNFSIEVYNIFLGLVLIPLNLIIAFGPTALADVFLYITIGLIALVIIMRSIRGLIIATPYIQGYTFHFFLYLCSFEIIPILLLVKMAQ